MTYATNIFTPSYKWRSITKFWCGWRGCGVLFHFRTSFMLLWCLFFIFFFIYLRNTTYIIFCQKQWVFKWIPLHSLGPAPSGVAASGWGGAARWSFAAVWRRRGPAAGFPKGELRVRHNSALPSLGGSELPRASPWRRRAPQGAFFFFLLFVQNFFYKTPPNFFPIFDGKVFCKTFSPESFFGF